MLVVINIVRQTCVQSHAQKSPRRFLPTPNAHCATTSLRAGLQNYAPGTWQVVRACLKICAVTYNKPFVY